jgi:hypothetical protein
MTEFGQFGMFLAVGFGALAIFFGPIGRAVGRRIEGSKQGGAGEQVMHDLGARVEQLEADRAHIAELEERLDFAERMLSQHRAPDRIGG